MIVGCRVDRPRRRAGRQHGRWRTRLPCQCHGPRTRSADAGATRRSAYAFALRRTRARSATPLRSSDQRPAKAGHYVRHPQRRVAAAVRWTWHVQTADGKRVRKRIVSTGAGGRVCRASVTDRGRDPPMRVQRHARLTPSRYNDRRHRSRGARRRAAGRSSRLAPAHAPARAR